MPRPAARGRVTSAYGPRKLNIPGVGPFHFGEDRIGDGNYSPDSGTVVFAGYAGAFGNAILVRRGVVVWNLAHHRNLNGRARGQSVNEGEFLAPQGATGLVDGQHVHVERRINGGDTIQSGAHTNPALYYTAPAPAGNSGSTPLKGFLAMLTDAQQEEMYGWLKDVQNRVRGPLSQPYDNLQKIMSDTAETRLRVRGFDARGDMLQLILEKVSDETPIDIDEAALAEELGPRLAPVLAPMLVAQVGTLTDETVNNLVKTLLDEQSRRLSA